MTLIRRPADVWFGVKTGKAQCEHMFSAFVPESGHCANVVGMSVWSPEAAISPSLVGGRPVPEGPRHASLRFSFPYPVKTLPQYRTDGGNEHVPLGIPGIALHAQECFRIFPKYQSCPPLDKFIRHADSHAHRD